MGSNWSYKNKEYTSIEDFPLDSIGFVYRITNLKTNKKYIGRKVLYFTKTKQVNKKKTKIKVESDWITYTGSNKILNEEVSKDGIDILKREILYFGNSSSELSYFEAKSQFENDVILDNSYYNDQIMCRIHSKHLRRLHKK
jgi:hypothetical protein